MQTDLGGGTMLTVKEVAERLRIGCGTVYNLCRDPGFPALRIGGQIRIPVEALEAWIKERGATNAQEQSGAPDA